MGIPHGKPSSKPPQIGALWLGVFLREDTRLMISTAADAREYETIAEAAIRHRVSTKTIRRRIADGYLVAYRFGPHLIRLNVAEVDAALSPIPTIGTVA